MHPDEGFIDQSPGALRLTVVEGNLDRRQFTLLKGGMFEHEGVRVEATVIGASHILSFETGLFAWHEVFACVEVTSVPHWTLPQLLAYPVERQLPGMRYEFAARLIAAPDGEPAELQRLIRDADCPETGIGVVQDFPRGTLPVTPKTVIVCNGDDQGVAVETAHFYPGEGLVLSRSSLRFTKEDPL